MSLKPIGKAQKDDIVGKQVNKSNQLSTKWRQSHLCIGFQVCVSYYHL